MQYAGSKRFEVLLPDGTGIHGARPPSAHIVDARRTPRVALRAMRMPHAGEQWRALAGMVLLLLGMALVHATGARAQGAGILAPGDAVVTGFSGIKAPDGPVPPGSDPLDAFHIDLDGASAQVFQLGTPGEPPQGQLISPAAPLKVKARDVGQVFAIALDDAAPPNIYLAATSTFGLQIVGPDADGDGRPDRLRKGDANAQWMAGQWGADKGGGPGSIYKVDGRTGAVTLFATIPGNGGAGLGDIIFDKTSRQLFVSDLDTGLIHRLDANGNPLDSFDHGTAGRPGAGLASVADDGTQANIKDTGFSVEDPATWGFTPKARLVWGMAARDGRLYYAAAEGPEIWSIGINADGSFAGDAREEVEVADTPAGHAVSDIAFDGEGRMYLAQRGEIRGSYDYSTFAEPERSVVRRYKRETPQDPATPGLWVPVPEEYAIGFPADYRNTSGGIALGYAYDEAGTIRRGACNLTLWSTGDNLRNSQEHAGKLGDEGPLEVHGLQGNDVSLVRPQNEPPLKSYFVDYDGQFGDADKAGHVGDVEIWQPCEGSPGYTQLYPGYPPPGYLPPGDWPPPYWPPPGEQPTNLRLKKDAKFCWKIGGGKHRCRFRITVTNTGPGVYHDHIQVRDTIPDVAGVTASFVSAKFDACPGGPPGYTCTTLAPVHLLPWEQVAIRVRVDVPDNLAKDLGCKVKNRARILHAPSPTDQNTDPTDDDDSDTAHLPAHLCKDPPKEKTNLKITKRALGCFEIAGNKVRCGYHVKVWNTGPGDYNDIIKVNESFPVGATPHFSGPPAVGWNCGGGNPATCTSNQVFLNPGDHVLLVVRLDVTKAEAKDKDCKLRNTARITYAPGGSDQNTNPGDDAATATGNIPAEICNPPAGKTNLKITKRQMLCAKIFGNKIRCKYHVRVRNMGPGTYNGKIEVKDKVPEGTTAGFAGPAGLWNCGGGNPATCVTNNPVVLNPAQNVLLVVSVDMTPARAKELGCKVRNRAWITQAPGGSPKNTNPADDEDADWAFIPPEICDAPAGKTNLKVTKVASPQTCTKIAQGWQCGYDITVENTGPGVYNDIIKLKETLPAEPVTASWNLGWNCQGTGGAGAVCKTVVPVMLQPTQHVTLKLKVSFSDADVIQRKCRLPNIVEITHVPGGNDENTNPADDKAGAVAFVPEEFCDGATNLKLHKSLYVAGAGPGHSDCPLAGGATWCKRFRMVVENTGPGTFNGQIKVLDIPAPGLSVSFEPLGQWTCNAATRVCQTNGNVVVPNGGFTQVFNVLLSGDDNDARRLNCKLNNWAQILTPQGAPKNILPADNQDHASYDLPAELCRGDLQLTKHGAHPQCQPEGNKWLCAYMVEVKNLGPSAYSGDIVVKDWIQHVPGPGTTMSALAPWDCEGNVSLTCTYKNAHLQPGHQVWLHVRVLLSPIPRSGPCRLANNARIMKPQGGSLHNQQANNDQDSASLKIPRPDCGEPEPSQQCPPGFQWVGDRCGRGPTIIPPPPPPSGCPEGQWLNKGHCCSVGLVWTGRRCGEPEKPECPDGTVGKWPNCREVDPPKCRPGWTPTSIAGRCCPPRTRWNGETCAPPDRACPEGTVGKWPNCRKVDEPKKCPEGTVGRWPNCRKIEEPKQCPPGTIGRWPKCKRPEPAKCPKGMVGTPPNCKRLIPEKCPAGMTGRPPNCKPPAVLRAPPLRVPKREPLSIRPRGRR